MLAGYRQRRRDAENIGHGVTAEIQAGTEFQGASAHSNAELARRSLGFSILHQLNAKQESSSAHIANGFMRLDTRAC